MGLLQTGTYTITSGEMTHRRDAEKLLQVDDRVIISGDAGIPDGLTVDFEGTGRIARSGLSFPAFSDIANSFLVINLNDDTHGRFLIAIRDLGRDAQGRRIQVLAYHHPGGDDSGGEWNGHG